MNRTLTCILCPNGCELEVVYEKIAVQPALKHKGMERDWVQFASGKEYVESAQVQSGSGNECAESIQIQSIFGNKCPKGAQYAEQEIVNPMRNIASSVNLEGGTMPLVSVRLTGPIPKARIMDVMAVIRAASVKAPVKIGDVVIPNVLGLGCDVIATRNVDARKL